MVRCGAAPVVQSMLKIDFLFGLIDSFSGQISQLQLDDARSGVLPLSG